MGIRSDSADHPGLGIDLVDHLAPDVEVARVSGEQGGVAEACDRQTAVVEVVNLVSRLWPFDAEAPAPGAAANLPVQADVAGNDPVFLQGALEPGIDVFQQPDLVLRSCPSM